LLLFTEIFQSKTEAITAIGIYVRNEYVINNGYFCIGCIPGVDVGNRIVDCETSSAAKQIKCANKAHNVTTISSYTL